MVHVGGEATHAPTNRAVAATPVPCRKKALLVSAALVTLIRGRKMIQVTNHHNHTYTLDNCVAVANFMVITRHQAGNAKPVPHAQVLLLNNYPKECEHILNELLHEQTETNAKSCYPTLETCVDPTKLNNIERRIYNEFINPRGKENLIPAKTGAQKTLFLSKLNWSESLRNQDEKARVEHLLVKYLPVFAKHHSDLGINTDISVKLTAQRDKPFWSQRIPTPTNLKNQLLVKLALMQEYGIIKILRFSGYSSLNANRTASWAYWLTNVDLTIWPNTTT